MSRDASQIVCTEACFITSDKNEFKKQQGSVRTNQKVPKDFNHEGSRGGRSHFFRLQLRSCSKIFESGSGPATLQIWESDSCSDSGCNHQSSRNLLMFLPKKSPHRLLLLPKRKNDSGSGSGFSQIFDSGSERKTQNPAGVDSCNPDPVPPLEGRSYA